MANYRITTSDDLSSGGAKTKAKKNIAAIELLKELEQSQRPASSEEQAILVTYSGWGAAADIFTAKPDWENLRQELTSLLTEEEYAAARASTINAFYTEVSVVSEIYKGLEGLGFAGGRILDPSMGATGLFEGAMPQSMAEASDITGIELDSISGRIASQLYPDANIYVQGFQEVALADNHFDLSISNVPFSEVGVNDARYKRLPVNTLHDYFFAKGLDKVRPGGLVAYITSTGTMQSAKGEPFRQYLGERANLVGAMRLPGDAFKKNAGTEVTTDLIILQKLGDGTRPNGIAWSKLAPTSILDSDGKPLKTNEYYVQRPELMLGELTDDKLYPGRLALKGTGRNLRDSIREAFLQMPTGIYQQQLRLEVESNRMLLPPELQSRVKPNGYVVHEGQLMTRSEDYLEPSGLSGRQLERALGLLEVRNAVLKVFDIQLSQGSDQALESAQAELVVTYDSFVDKNGYINQRGNQSVFARDPDYPLLLALEHYDPAEKKATKTDIFSKRTIQSYEPKTHADNAKEGLFFSLNEKGTVDIPYISELTSTSKLQVVLELQKEQLIFLEPTTKQWQTRDEYLSGNVKNKLAIAELARNNDSQFEINVDALIAVQPELIPPGDIDVRLGSAWVPSSDIESFTCELLGVEEGVSLKKISATDSWYMSVNSSLVSLASNQHIYGTEDRTALQLIETTLNLKNPSIYKIDPSDRDRRILDKEATTAARLKQEEIKEKFKSWVWSEPSRTERLTALYNDTFNTNRAREYDGSHLELPGKNPNFILRPHQRNAVYRSLFGNELLAHAVGAGKTATMVCSAMEQKRLGLANQPMFVVPNHMLEQFSGDIKYLYPTADILAATKKDSSKANRQKLMSRIATGQWDAVVVTHTAFEKLKLSDKAQTKFLQKEFENVKEALLSIRDEGEESRRLMKDLEKKRSALEEKIEAIANNPSKDNVVTFEQLGVDLLIVDESHYFKNLGYVTKMRNIAGLPNTNSNRAFDMLMKVQHMADVRGEGKGVIFATGTPIANSMAELYTIQRYLQPEELERMGLASFDDWASVFGETVTAAELSPTGKFQIKTRFSEFVNLPELMGSVRQIMDIQTAEMLKLPVPELAGGKPTVIAVPATDEQLNYMDDLVARAENMRNVEPSVDNMLKLTSNGRAASADMRLLDPNSIDDPDSKANRLVSDAYEFWQESAGQKTHLIFCDLGTPKKVGEFSLYQDIKEKLVAKGIPEKEIAFAQDYKTDARKLELQKSFNAGKVTVLIAGQQLETGFNGQRKLGRISHFTVPWRPDQVEQRDGRMIRQGNENKVVESFRYVTQGRNDQPGIDGYFWQTLENKSRFITQAINGDSGRRMEDISEKPLTYSEIKAIATGNPLIMEKATVDNTVSQLTTQKRAHTNSQYQKQQSLNALPYTIENLVARIDAVSHDLKAAKSAQQTGRVQVSQRTLDLTDVTEIGKRIRSQAAVLQKQEEHSSQVIGKLGSFTIQLRGGGAGYKRDPILIISGQTDYAYDKILGSNERAYRPLQHVLTNAIPEKLEKLEKTLEINRKNLADLSAIADAPFPKEAELLGAIQRQSEINAALSIDVSKSTENLASPSVGRRVASEGQQPDGLTQRIARFVEQAGLEKHVASEQGFYLVLKSATSGKDVTVDSDGKQFKLTTEVQIAKQPKLTIEATFKINESGLLSLVEAKSAEVSSLSADILSTRLAHWLSVNQYSTERGQEMPTEKAVEPSEPKAKDSSLPSTPSADSKLSNAPERQPGSETDTTPITPAAPAPPEPPEKEALPSEPNLPSETDTTPITPAAPVPPEPPEKEALPSEPNLPLTSVENGPEDNKTTDPEKLQSVKSRQSHPAPPSEVITGNQSGQKIEPSPQMSRPSVEVRPRQRSTPSSSISATTTDRSDNNRKASAGSRPPEDKKALPTHALQAVRPQVENNRNTVQIDRAYMKKAQLAAKYINNERLATAIGTVLEHQSTSSEFRIPNALDFQSRSAIKLAREKQQNKFAQSIISTATTLLRTAIKAGVTQSRNTEEGRVISLEGKNYSVRARVSPGRKELKVICHKTEGLVYSVNGAPEKIEGLLRQDVELLEKYASLPPAALREAVGQKVETER